MNTTDRFLKDYAECFNRGVETGDFRSWLKLLSPDVVMTFHGMKIGPFNGRDAVAAAYRRMPPDDEIEILDVKDKDGRLIVGYSWLKDAYTRAGEMRMILCDDGLVKDIELTV